jgi:DNA-binding NtrC family response regulator
LPRHPVAHSPALKALFRDAERIAQSDVPVLITGDSGTGKEVLARHLHRSGPRNGNPFCAINCGAIPAQLVEGTLFGHTRGAFTSADRDSKGLFREADGGTLFLDEVAELSATAQIALLRVLETQLVRPVGSSREVKVDVRIVSATNANVQCLVAEGRFREDLFYRIGAVGFYIPPLRDRLEDIDHLMNVFVIEACERWRRPLPKIGACLRAALHRYSWPGNARELRYVLEGALSISPDTTLSIEHLPPHVRNTGSVKKSAHALASTPPAFTVDSAPLSLRVAAYEAALIQAALCETSGNRTRAAEHLGLPLRTMMRKLAKHGLR